MEITPEAAVIRERICKKLDEAIALLAEYCDTVQIMASFSDGRGLTHAISAGHGNWYARYGLTDLWLCGQTLDEKVPDDYE